MSEASPATGARIRSACGADAAAIARIKAPYVTSTPYNFAYEPPAVEDVAADIRDTLRRYPYLVVEDKGGRVRGFAQAEPYRRREADAWNVELTVYVEEGSCGQGLGRALYAELLRLLAAQGVQNAYACVTAENEGSISFHRALGFVEVGRFPKTGYKLGAWHDTVYLWKSLGAHEPTPKPLIPFPKLA